MNSLEILLGGSGQMSQRLFYLSGGKAVSLTRMFSVSISLTIMIGNNMEQYNITYSTEDRDMYGRKVIYCVAHGVQNFIPQDDDDLTIMLFVVNDNIVKIEIKNNISGTKRIIE